MHWHKIRLSAQQISQGEAMRVQNLFNDLRFAAGGPKDMALFASRLRGHDFAELFFSPGSFPMAEPIVRTYGGESCEKPDRGEVDFLAGDQTAIKDLL
jgi:hypothetical protein